MVIKLLSKQVPTFWEAIKVGVVRADEVKEKDLQPYLNELLQALLSDKASSLLMIGITEVDGYFRKGDIISIIDEDGKYLGLGKSEIDSRRAEQYLGQKLLKPLIHYDYLVISDKYVPPSKA